MHLSLRQLTHLASAEMDEPVSLYTTAAVIAKNWVAVHDKIIPNITDAHIVRFLAPSNF